MNEQKTNILKVEVSLENVESVIKKISENQTLIQNLLKENNELLRNFLASSLSVKRTT